MINSPPLKPGEWELIESKDLRGATVGFYNLFGEQARAFKLILNNIYCDAHPSSYLYMQYNGDNANNYLNASTWKDSQNNSGSIYGVATSGQILTNMVANPRVINSEITIFPKKGLHRPYFGKTIMVDASTGLPYVIQNGGYWTNTTLELTSIILGSSYVTFTTGEAALYQLRI